MKSLGIIPARAGSTRLPGKHTRLLGGKPLVGWTIEAALGSGCFDEILVTTDDEGVRRIARDYGVATHQRAPEDATKEAKVIGTVMKIAWALESFNIVTLMLPTCPFRSANVIKMGFQRFTECDSLVSVAEVPMPESLIGDVIPYTHEFIPSEGLLRGDTNSLYLPKRYYPNGGFYIGHRESLLRNESYFGGKVKAFFMRRGESLDINTPEDWGIAQAYVKWRGE